MAFPSEHASFLNPPKGKIDIYVKHFNAEYHLLMSDLFQEVLRTHNLHINQLVPNGIDKVVAFEMLCPPNGINPYIWVFQHFFHFVTPSSGESYTFVVRKHRHVLVTEQKNLPKNWANCYYWVNVNHVGFMECRSTSISDKFFTLYSDKEHLARVLRSFYAVADDEVDW